MLKTINRMQAKYNCGHMPHEHRLLSEVDEFTNLFSGRWKPSGLIFSNLNATYN